MFAESELLPLSALQHLVYCPRQCALIHLDRVWDENVHTAEGRVIHERVHEWGSLKRGPLRREFALDLRSLRLGLFGQADVVEFLGEGPNPRPFPVEHKRGRPKSHDADRVQLCAQALCLEEMLGVDVPQGSIFYAAIRRREEVEFDQALRNATEDAARRLHELMAQGQVPPPEYSKARCGRCSLKERCLPETCGKKRPVAAYLARMLEES